ncbi:MlaD family protein [Thiorhodovibrio frisius]|uniref:ABC-type transport system involved in resistance to organic solvents, periplasmic component n=1 Tax=Thiorhodovibrio frisius TaxID=631362 RepID=H8Z4Y8_9GAMM|nr:MlaD family protein [Thiorhodovibrio frisius]EIC20395.1 ABC-type transport system involved in resistance to organic solvents, periplasmic component [Thiorhodovibrio frisius]WPL21136.1 Paraquat-inducible protein B [Thiorhodovibrio frisius]
MSKQANPAVIGGFVLGALVIFVGALIVFGSGALLRERIALVTFFPGSVQGLNIGAQVQFQGVPIGQITGIGLNYLPDTNNFRVPVRYDIWPKNIAVLGGVGQTNPRAVIRQLVKQEGLRARLQSISVVTGQYVVSLNLNPQLPAQPEEQDYQDAIQVPAIEATRDRMEDLLATLPLNDLVEKTTGTLDAIYDLFSSGKIDRSVESLDATLTQAHLALQTLNHDLKPLLDSLQQVLTNTNELSVTARENIEQIAPALTSAAENTATLTANLQRDWAPLKASAQAALTQGTKTLAALDSLVASDSPTRYQLDQLLRETTEAARSIRTLADYLERHPEALLSGKSGARAR